MGEECEEYKVNEPLLRGKFKKCLVCDKKFKLKEKIVLVPIQKPRQGWASAVCVPIHSECYWIEKGD